MKEKLIKNMKIKGIDSLEVVNSRVHNLKNVSVTVPRGSLAVFTGVSGSGKSSLAFDTIFAEGQRRYVESLSAYARMFLGQMDKPDVDFISGLSPAVSIDQKSTNKNPRSTVGTITEIYDYLRLLFARLGKQFCPTCGEQIEKQSVQKIVDSLLKLEPKTKFQLLAPIVRGRKGEYLDVFEDLKQQGFLRVKVDGEELLLDESIPKLSKTVKHDIFVTVDRLVASSEIKDRLTNSVETALNLSKGLLFVDFVDETDPAKKERKFSQKEVVQMNIFLNLTKLNQELFRLMHHTVLVQIVKELGIKWKSIRV